MAIRPSRFGFRELGVSNKQWTTDLEQRFITEGCESLSYVALDKGFTVEDLSFLGNLPGLRELRLLGDFPVDGPIENVRTLESLSINTSSTKPLHLGNLTSLRKLLISWKHRFTGLEQVSTLEEIEVFDFRSESLSWLGRQPNLRFLRLASRRRHSFSVSGIEQCRNLRTIWLEGGGIKSTRPFSELNVLENLMVRGTNISDITFVRHMPHLMDLDLESCGEIATVEPLRDHPVLRKVFLTGLTTVADGDLSPLLSIPLLASVAIGMNNADYRPSRKEINSLYPMITGPEPWK